MPFLIYLLDMYLNLSAQQCLAGKQSPSYAKREFVLLIDISQILVLTFLHLDEMAWTDMRLM